MTGKNHLLYTQFHVQCTFDLNTKLEKFSQHFSSNIMFKCKYRTVPLHTAYLLYNELLPMLVHLFLFFFLFRNNPNASFSFSQTFSICRCCGIGWNSTKHTCIVYTEKLLMIVHNMQLHKLIQWIHKMCWMLNVEWNMSHSKYTDNNILFPQ